MLNPSPNSEENTGGSSNNDKHHLTAFSLELLSKTKLHLFQQNNFKMKEESSSIYDFLDWYLKDSIEKRQNVNCAYIMSIAL